MTSQTEIEELSREIDYLKFLMFHRCCILLVQASIDFGLSERSRTAVALAAALLHVSVLDLRGEDTAIAFEAVSLELETYLQAMAA